MSNDVFANNNEISCKTGQGKSICCFPDVCMTPPENPATPPGVPVPYPNTGMASDTADGSRTVKISGKEIMLKNKSYFQKSTGNEAGCAAKKGVVTSVNRGKIYFISWSMDVKFEGENVNRHMDQTTHNHASLPSNTAPWPYIDELALNKGACRDERIEERAACGPIESKAKEDGLSTAKTHEALCNNTSCQRARKCRLVPYVRSGSPRCCEGKTAHHVVPAHCFMPPGERAAGGSSRYAGCRNYEPADAPCICVTGEDKSAGDHKKLHDKFDALEDENLPDSGAGTWTYAQARKAAVQSVTDVMGSKAGRCSPTCVGAQIDAYHQQGGRGNPNVSDATVLRADSSGTRNVSGTGLKLA